MSCYKRWFAEREGSVWSTKRRKHLNFRHSIFSWGKTARRKNQRQMLENCGDTKLLLGKGGLYGQTIRFSSPVRLHEPDADFLLMYWIDLK